MLAALDSKAFYEQFEKQWAPEVAKQYPIPQFGIKEFTPEEELAYILHPDVEPFVLRGGITAAMHVSSYAVSQASPLVNLCSIHPPFSITQRLLPQLSGSDEFFHRKAPHPSPQIFTIRPYRPEDKVSRGEMIIIPLLGFLD